MKCSLKAIIITSLLLNILLAAVIVGHMSRHLMAPNHDHDIQEMASALPESKRELFTIAMKRADDDNGELHEQVNSARKQAANILKANNFDKKAYLDQLQKIRDLREKMTQHMGEAIAGVSINLTQQERIALADAILNRHGSQ